MRRLLLRLELVDYVAIAVFVAAVGYASWVAWDVTGSGPDTASVEALPTTPSEQVAAPDEAVEPPPLGPFRAAASRASSILVVGDSTGAGTGAWVDLVAQDLGAERVVTLHQWDEQAEEFPDETSSYGDEGRQLDLWNLSYRGVDPDYPEHLGDLPRPDVVLLDIGHDRSPRAAARAATVTVDAISERWGDVPTAVILQNPSVEDEATQQRRAVRRLTRFAAEYGDPVIDVYTAFQRADPDQTLVDDDSRPTDDGFRLWADEVDRALGVTTSE